MFCYVFFFPSHCTEIFGTVSHRREEKIRIRTLSAVAWAPLSSGFMLVAKLSPLQGQGICFCECARVDTQASKRAITMSGQPPWSHCSSLAVAIILSRKCWCTFTGNHNKHNDIVPDPSFQCFMHLLYHCQKYLSGALRWGLGTRWMWMWPAHCSYQVFSWSSVDDNDCFGWGGFNNKLHGRHQELETIQFLWIQVVWRYYGVWRGSPAKAIVTVTLLPYCTIS